MRERAELIGGTLTIQTGDYGTEVIARVPIELDETLPPGRLSDAERSRPS